MSRVQVGLRLAMITDVLMGAFRRYMSKLPTCHPFLQARSGIFFTRVLIEEVEIR